MNEHPPGFVPLILGSAFPAACHDVSEALRFAAKTAETLANIAFEEAPAFPRAGFLKPETFPSLRARFELCKGGIPSKSRIAGAYMHSIGWISLQEEFINSYNAILDFYTSGARFS